MKNTPNTTRIQDNLIHLTYYTHPTSHRKKKHKTPKNTKSTYKVKTNQTTYPRRYQAADRQRTPSSRISRQSRCPGCEGCCGWATRAARSEARRHRASRRRRLRHRRGLADRLSSARREDCRPVPRGPGRTAIYLRTRESRDKG